MGKHKSSIQTKFFNKMIYLVLISIGLWGFVWIYGEKSTFQFEAESLRTEYVESQKNMLKDQVNNVVNGLNNLRNDAENALKQTIMEQVNQAYQIALNIYQQNYDSKKLPEIKEMIKDALRPMRFNGGRGYYFAVSMDGIEQLYPVRPEFEGKNLIGLQDSRGNFVIQEEIKIIQQLGEGFVKSFWTKPNEDPNVQFPKITFLKFFKPLNWYIGTGGYLDEFEKKIQAKVLKRISKFRFGTEGYIFGSTYQGDPLFSNGKITIGSGNVWNLTDPNGVKIIQEQKKAAENPEGGFVYYSWNKLNTSEPSPKISYVRGIPDWQWTIGAGIYLDNIEQIILVKKAALYRGIKKRIIRSIWILAGLLCLIYFWSKRISHQIANSVETCSSFLNKAATESVSINPDDIQLMEFREIAISTNKMLEDRIQAEKASLESEIRFKKMIQKSPLPMVITDEKHDISYLNDKFTELFGYTLEDVSTAGKWWQIAYPDEKYRRRVQQSWKNAIAIAFEKNTDIEMQVWDLTIKDGTQRTCEFYLVPLDDFSLIIMNDITMRRAMEADRNRHLAAIEQIEEGVVITDTDGSIEYVNPAFEKITGYLNRELIGQNPRILQSGEHDDAFYRQLWETISSGDTWKSRLINKRKNGSFYNEEATISPVFDKSGKIINFVAVKRDITDEIRMEARLQQSQKMESIGTLAGGVAHDFNNILFPIIGHTEMLLEDVPEDSPFMGGIKQIYTGAMRASELVKQILTFSRQNNTELRLMKIQHIVKEALKLIRSTIPTTIEIKQHIQADCGAIKADPTQVHQIIMNLATNAYHAMEETGGELTINLKEIQLGEYDLITPDMSPGLYACLSISDTGMGMDKTIMDRIFDPFFTTREKGKGTGMGLSVVHGIVKNMNGEIKAYSEPGRGTEFHVYLPVAKYSFQERPTRSNLVIQGGMEHILLVDDEEAILTMEKMMLERLGYQVTSRTSSIEALEAFRDNPDKFDIVITDMAMPNMPGNKLAVKLTGIRPGIPILLCTGFSETMSEEKAASLGIRGFLLKPIVMRDLSQKIREILDIDKKNAGQR